MNKVSSKKLLDCLNWRCATKQFDPLRRIDPEDWQTLEAMLMRLGYRVLTAANGADAFNVWNLFNT